MSQRIDVTLDGLRQLRQRIDVQSLEDRDWPVIGALVSGVVHRQETRTSRLIKKAAALAAAAKAAFHENPNRSADPDKANGPGGAAPESPNATESPGRPGAAHPNAGDQSEKPKPKNHGRNGSLAFSNAKHFYLTLIEGMIGSPCKCGSGCMTRHREHIRIRVVGQPMFGAELYHAEQARCRTCGRVATATLPQGVADGLGKAVTYHWSACAMLIVLHYFSGMPFKRLESLHKGWGIPFADSNQWEIVRDAMALLKPLLKALELYALQNVLNLRMDDTGSMILALRLQITAELAAAKALGESEDTIRAGINASGFYIETPAGVVMLFYTGRHHASEVLRELLKLRPEGADKVVKITDCASKNFEPEQAELVVEGGCNAHAFLKFHDIKTQHPTEYALVGEGYNKIFDNDAKAKEQKLSPANRLAYHQMHSRPWMEKIKDMCMQKIASGLVEPNSALWEPLSFIINQWPRLTKFLEVENMPLDTNLIEQGLIIPVRYLAASFNYQTKNGAEAGDQGMSLAATAKANNIEPVAWITHCLENHQDLAQHPDKYLPWVYAERMKALKEAQSKPPDVIH